MGKYIVQAGDYEGLEIETKKVNPSLVQRVMSSIKLPKRPTYETRTASGRVEVIPMDEVAAAQTPGGESMWEYYTTELTQARLDQNEKVVKALFMLGTECKIPDDGWDEIDEMLGLYVPEKPNERRAHFLMTHLEPEDIIGLTSSIMRETGVSEEAINEAEGSFRGALRNGSERSGDVVDAERDSGRTAKK